MIGNQNGIKTALHGYPRILMSVDTFDDEFSAPELSELIDELPVHGWIRRANSGHIDTFEHWAPRQRPWRFPRSVTRHALAAVFRARAEVGFAVAAGRVVHCQHHDRRP